MRRYTTLCIIRFITGIIEWYIIILYTIRCITKRIKKTRTLVSGFFLWKTPWRLCPDDYAFAVVVFDFCWGVAAGASPPRGLFLAKSTRNGAATKIEE
jgi:hypothetical protein